MKTFDENTVIDINVFVTSVLRSKDLNWPKILDAVDSPFKNDFSLISKAISTFPDAPWGDAWSKGQLISKSWLIKELTSIKTTLSCVYVMGGWLGVLPWMMFRSDGLNIDKIRTFDIDPTCYMIADKLNIDNKINNWKFKAITSDATQMKFSRNGCYDIEIQRFDGTTAGPWAEKPDCIINTSCDHFLNLAGWVKTLPKESLIVLQNTDAKHDDTHVGIVNTVEEFKLQANLSTVLFSGTLSLESYKRFMLIGYK
jgi:hypothetical protein